MSEATVLAFVAAALAVPGVTSLVTSFLRTVGDALGVDPRLLVYVASIVITGVILASAGTALPEWAGDGPGFVAAWLVMASTNAELARRIYEGILEKVYKAQPA